MVDPPKKKVQKDQPPLKGTEVGSFLRTWSVRRKRMYIRVTVRVTVRVTQPPDTVQEVSWIHPFFFGSFSCFFFLFYTKE